MGTAGRDGNEPTEVARRDPVELGLLVALLLLAGWVVVYALWQAGTHHLIWTGSDGYFPVDQYQYLAWVRDASRHLLVSDLYVLRGTPHDYLEPLVVLAGALTALGLAPWLALLVCVPGVVVAVFAAVRAYCRRALRSPWERSAALALALFFGTLGVLGDEWIPFLTWGYLPAVLAIAAIAGAVVAYEGAVRTGRRPWLPGVLGLFASWLHPWQGEELAMIVVGLAVLGVVRPAWVGGRRLALAALTLAGTLLPLAYYEILDRADAIWRLGEAAGAAPWSLGAILAPLTPLLVVAAVGWLGRPRSALEAATRLWPLAALAEYLLFQLGIGAAPLHAFGGITVPLAVLAVQGVQRVGLHRVPGYRWVGAVAVLAATVPATIHMLAAAPSYIAPRVSNAFLTADEQRALTFLANVRGPGGVVSTQALGEMVPSETGRRTYVGDCYWSLPRCDVRMRTVGWLFSARLGAGARAAGTVRRFVAGSGARFVLAPCSSSPWLGRDLAPLVVSTWRRGCVRVWTVRG